jgi:hypothetical protein
MSRREPMKPIEGLKKPADLPGPTARPRTLNPVPTPAPAMEPEADSEVVEVSSSPTLAPVEDIPGPRESQEPEPKSAGRAKRQKAAGERKPKASSTAETMKPVSVSVPFTLAEAWRDRAKNDRTSQVDVLLDAIVAHQDELTAVMAAASERPTVSDGLFDRGATGAGERFVGVSLRIKSTNLAVIDKLADKHGPAKRSPFVAAVLAAYLDLGDEE